MPTKNDPMDISVASDGSMILKFGAEITLYWRGSMFERAEALVALYQRVLADLRPTLRFFETGTMSGAKPLKADTLDMLPFWLTKAKRRRDIYMLNLESGRKPNEPSDRSFFFIADEDDDEPFGALRIGLPVADLQQQPKGFSARVVSYIGDLSYESGHAGFGMNWDPRGDSAMEAQSSMAAIAARYHCVDLFDFDVTMVAMRRTHPATVKRVSWITLLGSELLGIVGGLPALSSLLDAPITLHGFGQGALLQAGPRPLLGQVNRREDLSAYMRVGALLSAYRPLDHKPLFGSEAGDPREETSRWLARFDRP